MPITRKKPPARIAAKKKAKQEEEAGGVPFNTFGLPFMREGEYEDILRESQPEITITLPFNQFYLLWEIAEAKARKNEKYAGMGGLDFFAKSWRDMSLLMRERFYSSSYGYAYFTRELGRKRLRDAEAKKTPRGTKTVATAPEAAERATAAPAAKKTRCTSEKKGVRCLGPAGHKSEIHKGKLKSGRKVQWRDA